MTLRSYQTVAVSDLWRYWKNGGKSPLIVAPTGAGKSHIIADVVARVWRKTNHNVLMLTHRKELVEQNAAKILAAEPELDIGIYSASLGRKHIRRITCAQIQSFARADLDGNFGPSFRLVVVDEAHLVPHVGMGQYRSVLARLRERDPEMRIMGLTATEYRMMGGYLHQGEGAIFDGIAHRIEVQALIDSGHLVEPVPYAPDMDAGLDSVRKNGGEYAISAQDEIIDEKVRKVVDRIDHYAEGRKKILVFCPGRAAVARVAEAMAERMETAAVDGTTPISERDDVVARFRAAGGLRCLVNCDVLTTGFDAPATDMIVLLRATASPVLHVQMIGRGMRPAPGKKNCLVVDFGGNCVRHGPIDDIRPKARNGDGAAPPMKECPACHRLAKAAAKTCPECGAAFPEPRRQKRDIKETTPQAAPVTKAQAIETNVISCGYFRGRGRNGKPDHVFAEYFCDATHETVREFFCPEHPGLASAIWRRKRAALGSTAETVDQCEAEMDRWPKPLKIRIARDGRYWQVRSAVYPDSP